jgi:excinuclease UvrABC helicase subunit UvrB
MIHTRAAASILFKAKRYRPALEAVEEGLNKIRAFFANFNQEELFAESSEVKVLKRFARDIRRRLPVDPLRKLQTQLDKAIRNEKYEEAAKLRDQIAAHRPAER